MECEFCRKTRLEINRLLMLRENVSKELEKVTRIVTQTGDEYWKSGIYKHSEFYKNHVLLEAKFDEAQRRLKVIADKAENSCTDCCFNSDECYRVGDKCTMTESYGPIPDDWTPGNNGEKKNLAG